MKTIRWIRLIFSSIFILLGLIFGTYFYIKEHPSVSALQQGCIVRISHKNNITTIPFGAPECPQ